MVMYGLSYQGYMLFDTLDGRQARRTGNSSPLGMLFDHGCDAIVASVGSATLIKLFALKPCPESLIVSLTSSMPFYFITME